MGLCCFHVKDPYRYSYFPRAQIKRSGFEPWPGALCSGADPGEVKWVNFHPPFSKPPSFFFFSSYPSNIEIIFDISDIITKIHPPFQNPGSALGVVFLGNTLNSCSFFLYLGV